MDDNEKRDLEARSKPYILLTFAKDHDSKRAEFTFAYLSPEDGKPRNYSDWHSHPKYDLNDLIIQSHYHDDDGTFFLFNPFCYLRRYHVGEEDCEKMGKTLKSIRAKLNKIGEQLGHASTLEDFTARVALAVGCVGFLREGAREERTGYGSSSRYTDNEYIRLDVPSMQYYIRNTAREWNPKRELVAA